MDVVKVDQYYFTVLNHQVCHTCTSKNLNLEYINIHRYVRTALSHSGLLKCESVWEMISTCMCVFLPKYTFKPWGST